jgi:hypothetical protein
MSKTTHLCVSVREMLHWGEAETRRNLKSITKNDGTRFTSLAEFKNSLMDELAAGHEVLPMGEPCEGFDYKKGCPGHEVADAPEAR